MSTKEEIIAQEYEYWLRIVTLIHYGGQEIFIDILYNREGFPNDGGYLYKKLCQHQKSIKEKLNHKIIR